MADKVETTHGELIITAHYNTRQRYNNEWFGGYWDYEITEREEHPGRIAVTRGDVRVFISANGNVSVERLR